MFPVYEFARVVGGDDVDVSMLLPPGVESHGFEPRPSDIVGIAKCDVFLYAGAAMEPWAADVADATAIASVYTADLSKGIPLADDDPHYWLDLANAQLMVDTVASVFAEKDPLRADAFRARATLYKNKLEALDLRAREVFSHCDRKVILYAGHNVFAYFARRYGLLLRSPYEGFSPDAEPSPKALISLARAVKETKSHVLFHEEAIDPKVARIIADETGVRLALLHGAHTVTKDERAGGVTFLSLIEDDIVALQGALGCR
jgi:zinc transport system substrate-binding protein